MSEVKFIIKKYELDDVLFKNKNLYNVSNLWDSDIKPLDYDDKRKISETRNWVNLFHDNVIIMTIEKSDLTWIREAGKIGSITKRFPKIFKDELNATCAKYEKQIPPDINNHGYFIRTEHNSAKYGMYGAGPYKNIRQIIKSFATTSHTHLCIMEEDDACQVYFIDWIDDFDNEKEFRVFVMDNKITAVSVQHLYQVNHWLNSLSDNEIFAILNSMIIYFNNNIKNKLVFINSYVMDIYYKGDNQWYFIEPNSFGSQYTSGSALFHWKIDHNQLYGVDDVIEFRYVSK